MLKIRDNLNLKELEKFGFKKQPKPYTGYYICIARGIKILMVCSNEGNREIIIDKWYDNDPRAHKKQIASIEVINRYMMYYMT